MPQTAWEGRPSRTAFPGRRTQLRGYLCDRDNIVDGFAGTSPDIARFFYAESNSICIHEIPPAPVECDCVKIGQADKLED